MSTSTTVKITAISAWIIGLVLVLLPFHAFLTVWLSSLAGHYTLLRLWKELLLVGLTATAAYWLLKDEKVRRQFLASRTFQLIGLYGLVSVIWGLAAYGLGKVTLKALGFGFIVNLRFLLFFLIVWIIATKSPLLRQIWPKLLLTPAAAVIIIGLIQRLVLPYDVLKHFGYGPGTIFPYQTVNYNVNYPRIMSTLRGANPLGTYLVLIISTLTVLLIKQKNRRWLWGVLGAAGLAAIFFSYSRGAWIGLLLSWLFLAWVLMKKQAKRMAVIGLVMLVAFAGGFALAVRGNNALENAFFHTDSRSTAKVSSNQEHLSNFKEGAADVLSEPLGRGVGTAGPASVYNKNQSRVAENYYLQIGQELGWLGLGLFAAINVLVAFELWRRRKDNLALALVTAFVGLSAVNLVSHAWTDDTLAYIWWGLAGLALAKPAVNR